MTATNSGGLRAPALVSTYLDTASGRTRQNRAGYLRRWLAWCEARDLDWESASADDIMTWGADLRGAGLAGASVSSALSAARGLYRWLWTAGHRPDDASARVVLPRRERVATWTWLGRSDLSALLGHVRHGDDPHTALAIHLWGLSGLRLGEALRADVQDLSEHEGAVTLAVRRSKATGRDRIALPSATAALIAACADGRARGPLLRSQTGDRLTAAIARKRLARACEQAGVPRVTPQGLRVGWITLALIAGIPEREVAISAGHASSVMTARYDQARHLVERTVGQRLADWLETED